MDATKTMTKHIKSSDSGDTNARLNFEGAVSRAFDFLYDIGFLQTESSPTIVRYRKDDVEIDVYYGQQSYELGLEIGYGGAKYPMSGLIRIVDPAAASQYHDFAATTYPGLIDGLTRLKDLAKQYGQRAFRGDPEFFVALENQRKSWAKEYALDVLEGQLRPKADEAFRRGNYREAVELYERIQPRLTPAGLKKLAIARKRDRG